MGAAALSEDNSSGGRATTLRNTDRKIFRAKWALPIAGPPIENGQVVVEGNRIAEVCAVSLGTQTVSNTDQVIDFGDAVLMPGLVNVHTHLDYTVMRGLLEDIEFFPWVRELTARKAVLTQDDWEASATMGAAEAVAGGVTTIGDCTSTGAALIGAKRLGLRGIIFQEVFGIDTRQTVAEILAELETQLARLSAAPAGSLLTVGISPHAPYTVRAELMTALAAFARRTNLPICIHVAESRAEAELLRSGHGVIADAFRKRGIDWTPPQCSTVAYLDACGILGERTLLVHGVQVSASDRVTIRERRIGWAHCPKSNAKLGNGVAPLGILGDYHRTSDELDVSGNFAAPYMGRIGLGSDSVASNNTMDMFEEMRFAVLMQRGARHRIQTLAAREAVEMATIGGANALGMADEIGTLEAGKRADLCVVRLNELHSLPAYDPYNALVYAARASDVCFTMIDGEVRYNTADNAMGNARLHLPLPAADPNSDLDIARKTLLIAAQKMRDWRPTS